MRSEMEELYGELKYLRETQLKQIDKKSSLDRKPSLKKPTVVKNHRLSTEDDEFQSIENEINRATSNIGSSLSGVRGSFSGRQKQTQKAMENLQFEKIEEQIREESPTKSEMNKISNHTQSVILN